MRFCAQSRRVSVITAAVSLQSTAIGCKVCLQGR
jgi:hypothetical protein